MLSFLEKTIKWTGLALAAAALSCVPKPSEDGRRFLNISVEKQAAFVRNFNPLLPSGARDFTIGAIYEPLFLYNRLQGETLPWLATSYEWIGKDYKGLRMKIRNGVSWSDGKPFSAADVVFTFQLIKRIQAFDINGVWSFLGNVELAAPDEVLFSFKRVYVPGFSNIAGQIIVPEHIWSKIEDPLTFANPEPVGTGPFTEITLFRDQVFELAKNPNYWQKGKPYIDGLRFPAYASNDQANLALIKGDVDLAGNFVPAVERIYAKKDPKHHHYWSPLVGPMIFLYLNTKKPPFDQADVRKAISMAINRPMVVEVAMFRYTDIPHPSGLTDAFKNWRLEPTPDQAASINYAPDRAQALLATNGWTRKDKGPLQNAAGETLSLELTVVNGWSDWVRAAQIIASNLQALGIDAKVKSKDFGAWFEGLQKGTFDASIAWSGEGADPYPFYRGLMAEETVQAVGTAAPSNWHRVGDPEVSRLLREFEGTADEARKKEIIDTVQNRFMDTLPALPLFPAPAWGEYNSRYFEGFPHAGNPYGMLSPNFRPEILLMLTTLRPVTHATAQEG